MKECRRWTTTGGSQCVICEAKTADPAAGLMCAVDVGVVGTSIRKFVCGTCAVQIADVIHGEPVTRRMNRGAES